MANTKLIFCSSEQSEMEGELQAFCNTKNEIFISITSAEGVSAVCLDKRTAIKLVKNLRSEIAKIIDAERKEAGYGNI